MPGSPHQAKRIALELDRRQQANESARAQIGLDEVTRQHRNASTYDQHFHDIQILPDSHLAKLYPNMPRARVNSIHHQGIKRVAPEFVVEALSEPDGVPEAIRLKPAPGRGYIAATQWHPEFHKQGSDTLDDTAILNDFLAACEQAKAHPRPVLRPAPSLRERAARRLRKALSRQRD